MPLDYLPNTATQLERALRAHLFSVGAVGAKDCFISNDSRSRNAEDSPLDKGITDIIAYNSITSESEDSGNEKFQVSLINKFGATVQPGEPNAKVNQVLMDQRVGRQMLALGEGEAADLRQATCTKINTAGRALVTATDSSDAAVLEAANNEDMSEFTCLSIRYLGMTRGQPDDNSCAWIETRRFEIAACSSNVD